MPVKPLLVISTEVLPPAFHWDPRKPIRGTEKFYVKTAEAATKTHQVSVLYDGRTAHVNGVEYFNRAEVFFDQIAHLIVCNPRGDDQRIKSAVIKKPLRTSVWTNFYMPSGYNRWFNDLVDGPFGFDELIVISQYAKRLLRAEVGPTGIDVRVVPHGIDHAVYKLRNSPFAPDRKRTVLFTSSPDRGWDQLQALWEQFDIEAEYGYQLKTFAYGTSKVDDESIAKELQEASFWIHPGSASELFCLSAAEAQACGCTPIVVPLGALSETVRYGYRFPKEAFVSGLLAVLGGEATMEGITANHIPSWELATEWLLGSDTHSVG